MTAPEPDHIVVGGGSAGCVVAARLVRAGARVLLLEAGGPYRGLLLRAPAGFSRILGGRRHLTRHRTVPQDQLGGRVQLIPQARVLGGGSSINAQAYMRGHARDYDDWGRVTGSDLWSWARLLPHFLRQEGNQKFLNDWHGGDGPLLVSDPAFVCRMSHLYVRTLQGLGLPYTADFNRGAPAGTGYVQVTARDGRRCSAVDAFLAPLAGDPRLVVRTRARVLRVLIEGGRACGVEVAAGAGRETLRCTGEVILSAGAFASPQLLMLSGIGPADALRGLGVPVVADLPGVGANLHDHCGAPVIAATRGRAGYFTEDRGWRLLRNGLEYLLFRRGPVAANGVEAFSFHVPEAGTGEAIVQIWCVPKTSYLDEDVRGIRDIDGVTLHAVLMRPRSRGTLRLRSADPADLPLVDPRYLADPADLAHLREGLRIARAILAARPLADIVTGEIAPGPAAAEGAALDAHIRRTVKTDYHPVGTCRMGAEGDPMAVLTPELRVRGVERLRVVDASAMPVIPTANTNAPTMALADRAMDLMLGATASAPSG